MIVTWESRGSEFVIFIFIHIYFFGKDVKLTYLGCKEWLGRVHRKFV